MWVVIDLFGPLALGALIGRRWVALTVVLALGSLAFWWPADGAGDEDWRPIVYPFWVAWLAGITLLGGASRRLIERRR